MKKIPILKHYAIPCSCDPVEDHGVDLSSVAPRAWFTNHDELVPSDAHLIRDDVTGLYTPQGACTDGAYIYRALVAEDDLPTKLQKIYLATGEIVKESTALSFGHANDMTYRQGKLYIAHSSSTSTVYEVDADTFELLATHEIPLKIWGIAYDPVNDLFVFGGVGSAYFSVYYPDFSFMYRIKPDNPYTGLVRQGIFADENYIYVALDNAYGTILGNENGSRIMVYTWNGMFIKSLYIPINEIEWGFPIGDKMYIGTYEGRNEADIKSGKIYAIPYDLYPEQTVITGRPTDVSGGLNNLQRLPEGTPVRLWRGSATSGVITLESKDHNVTISEDSPFRYLRFRFKGANEGVFDWYPNNNGIVAIREVDVTGAESDSNFRVREARLQFNNSSQSFTIDSNYADGFLYDKSEDKLVVTKYTDSSVIELITITQIWGIV